MRDCSLRHWGSLIEPLEGNANCGVRMRRYNVNAADLKNVQSTSVLKPMSGQFWKNSTSFSQIPYFKFKERQPIQSV